ncbi:MAG: AAA family ATPase, partial [Gaiellaceae bacterium]
EMAGAIKTLVAVDQDISREDVVAALPASAGDIEITSIVEGLDDAWKMLQETTNDLLVVGCSGHSERVLLFIENAVRDRPNRPVVVLCQGSPNGFVRRVFEAGADDILRLPESSDALYFTLQKAVARKQGTPGGGVVDQLSPLVCILGPKGGTGKTLIAANLGVVLAEQGHRVAAVDLDLQFGDLGLSLGLAPEQTIFDLSRSAGAIDGERIGHYLVQHESGLRVLLAPSRPDQAAVVTVELLREVYQALRASHDYVLVDTPPGFTPEVIATIDSSTEVIVVGMLDALSLKNTKLGLETLDLMGYDRKKVRVVLNRADSRVGITADDVAAVLGHAPDVLLPSDREVPRALNEGVPIVMAKPQSAVTKAFKQLASSMEPKSAPAAATTAENGKQSRRLLGKKA